MTFKIIKHIKTKEEGLRPSTPQAFGKTRSLRDLGQQIGWSAEHRPLLTATPICCGLTKTFVMGIAELCVILGTDHSANDLSSTKHQTQKRKLAFFLGFRALCATFRRTRATKLKMTTITTVRKFLGVWGLLSKRPHISFHLTSYKSQFICYYKSELRHRRHH